MIIYPPGGPSLVTHQKGTAKILGFRSVLVSCTTGTLFSYILLYTAVCPHHTVFTNTENKQGLIILVFDGKSRQYTIMPVRVEDNCCPKSTTDGSCQEEHMQSSSRGYHKRVKDIPPDLILEMNCPICALVHRQCAWLHLVSRFKWVHLDRSSQDRSHSGTARRMSTEERYRDMEARSGPVTSSYPPRTMYPTSENSEYKKASTALSTSQQIQTRDLSALQRSTWPTGSRSLLSRSCSLPSQVVLPPRTAS